MGDTQGIGPCFDYLRKYLPKQGPLEFFIHHNPFHEFEGLPFKDALRQGKLLYRGRVLREEAEYRSLFESGRISDHALNDAVSGFLARSGFDAAHGLHVAKALLTRDADRPWRGAHALTVELSGQKEQRATFFKDMLIDLFNLDLDEAIGAVVYRFLSLYFDQGSAYWKMPRREKGLWSSFCGHHGVVGPLALRWERKLALLVRRHRGMEPRQVVEACLHGVGISKEWHEQYLFDLALRFKGWGALILAFERKPHWNKVREVKPDFEAFVAVLAICEWAFLESLEPATRKAIDGRIPGTALLERYSSAFLASVDELIDEGAVEPTREQHCQLVRSLDDFERCFLWHEAYEEDFYANFLDTLTASSIPSPQKSVTPEVQVVCCLDEREESLRRYIEAEIPSAETFGIAGHFGLDMEFKGVLSAHYRALCPDPVKPSRRVHEVLVAGERARALYRFLGNALQLEATGARTLVRGLTAQLTTGILAGGMFALSVLSPKVATRARRWLNARLATKISTRLAFQDPANGGFSSAERASYAEALLRTIGLRERFAPVIFILGHGTSTINNPHEAAYDCGACGGGKGAPNARLITTFLNDMGVRCRLVERGYLIPFETVFVGGMHNTTSSEIVLFDVPGRDDVKKAAEQLRRAARADARERVRRFEDVALSVSADEAAEHCITRSGDIMQPRPEYGHATNALCFVGPRRLTRNLFLDRRAFLVSYDHRFDDELTTVLKQMLTAVSVVCSGINLEYYFSFMDNTVFGCGTKLPHNVTSLLGVMNGYQSDLLLGLAWQMVELHDPYRLMMVVATTESVMQDVLAALPVVRSLVENQWIHLAIYDENNATLLRFKNRKFQPVRRRDEAVVEYETSEAAYSSRRGPCRMGALRRANGN